MKWLFIIVALLNISFGAYNLFLEDDLSINQTNKNTAGKKQIVLLNELDATELKELQDKILPVSQSFGYSEGFAETSEFVSPVNRDNNIQKNTSALNNVCFKLGPFTKDSMNDIRQALEVEYQNQLSFGIETTSDITYYRIYIPPLADKEKIKETLVVLDKNGLKDHYVMSIDGRKNAIALGVFKQRSAAEKVANKAAQIGLSTTIEAISDDKNSLYQLLVIFQASQDIIPYQEIILQKELISVKCDK